VRGISWESDVPLAISPEVCYTGAKSMTRSDGMKTRKIIAYILVLVMVLGLFAGCKKSDKKPTEPQNDEYD
jgi:hypothetical protein